MEIFNYDSIIETAAKETSSAHEAIRHVESERPLARPSLFISDSTSKGLQAGLAEQSEYQAICEPEGDLLLKVATNPGFDIALLLRSFGREEYTYGKIPKKVTLNRPSLNILYGVQPEVAAKFYQMNTHVGRGLTARFMPVFVRYSSPKAPCINMATYNRKITDLSQRYYNQATKKRAQPAAWLELFTYG